MKRFLARISSNLGSDKTCRINSSQLINGHNRPIGMNSLSVWSGKIVKENVGKFFHFCGLNFFFFFLIIDSGF